MAFSPRAGHGWLGFWRIAAACKRPSVARILARVGEICSARRGGADSEGPGARGGGLFWGQIYVTGSQAGRRGWSRRVAQEANLPNLLTTPAGRRFREMHEV